MSTFVQQGDALYAVSASPTRRQGENGSIEFASTKTALLDIFFQLVRGADVASFEPKLDQIIGAGAAVDLFVLMFQTRDCRGGKGEKKLFYDLFALLYKKDPKNARKVLDLIPTYGYYKDYWNILECVQDTDLRHQVMQIYSNALFSDVVELRQNPENPVITLAAKYAPREQHEFAMENKALFATFVKKYMFPNTPEPKKLYRKLIAKLNRALQVTEVYMCAKRYSEINFHRVPSLCLKRFRKAFLNEVVNRDPDAPRFDEERGDRFPDDPDRVAARQNLKALLGGGADGAAPQIKAKQLMPHEIVSTLLHKDVDSKSEKDLLQAQWEIISDAANVRGNFIPLVDVSSSMEGTPMEVAIALGILISETTNPMYRHRVITFHENPSWVCLSEGATIMENVETVKNAQWGGSTDFAAAIDLILNIVVSKQLQPSEIPDLIVFSDMQFNQADHTYATHYETITQKFHDEGVKIHGTPYRAPRIVFWNLRATEGFPVLSDTNNTMMLSGFSPALMRAFLGGEDMKDITPIKTLMEILDNERYNPVREKLAARSAV